MIERESLSDEVRESNDRALQEIVILFQERWETIKVFKQGVICDFNSPSPRKKNHSTLLEQDKSGDRISIKRHLQLSKQQSQRFRIRAELLCKATLVW